MMTPQTEDDLAKMISGATGSLRVQGGGTRCGALGPAEVLTTAGLSGIVDYEPGALTLVVKAGTPVAEVEAALAAEGQRLAFEPMDHRLLLGTNGAPTMGGLVAMNVSGPRRVQVGACRDFLLGVRFVDGAGRVLKNGGRVMKNVTGYDLVKLMAGSRGTLGVMTELSFKVLAQPETSATLVWEGTDWTEALSFFTQALGSPFDVSGAARLPDGRAMVRVEGLKGSVAYRAEQLAKRMARVPDAVLGGEADQIWQDVRDVAPFAGQSGNVWKTSVKPSDMIAATGVGHDCQHLVDWGGGLIWTLAPQTFDLRAALSGIAGQSTLVRGQGFAMVPPEPAPVVALSQGIRAQFDPRGILNPGLMEAAL